MNILLFPGMFLNLGFFGHSLEKKLAFVDKIQSSILTVKVQAKVSQYSKKTNDFLFGKIPAQFYRRNVVLRKIIFTS